MPDSPRGFVLSARDVARSRVSAESSRGSATSRIHFLLRAWRNPFLRRLCLAVAGFRLAELGVWIAITAYAYAAGGVGEASAVMIAQLIPATAFALAVGGLIRRYGPGNVLRWGLAVQTVALCVAAVFLRSGDNVEAYVAAIVLATAVTTTRPAHSVLTPNLVDGPDDLTAANVFSGVLMAAASLAGPALAAVIMTTTGSWAVFAVMAVVVALSTVAVWRFPSMPVAGEGDPESLLAGARATAREPGPRVMVLAVAAYFLVVGAVDVLAVVIAVELLHETEAFAGYVTAAVGLGCVIAGSISVALIGRRWIAPWIVASALAISLGLVGISVVGSRVSASLLVLVAFGIAEATYELTSLMLLQRVSRLDLIGHVFAIVEALQMAMLAVGAALVPLAVYLFGSHWAPAAIGGVFAGVIAVLGARIVQIDRHARVPITEMAALRATPQFGVLPGPALETVARETRRLEVPAGEVVIRQGDPGTEFFTVISGRLSVTIDGDARGDLERGDGFGEIALLRDVPRSATITAATDAVLLAVERDPFLTAVTGHAATRDRTSSIVDTHLEGD